MDSLKCVAHYSSKDFEYSDLIPLSDHAHSILLEAKAIRLEKDVQNEHQEQCSSIPNEVDYALHGIHMEPCYKKFTVIISKARNERKTSNDSEDDDALRKKSRAQRTSVGGNLFPDHCYFCKKKRKSVKGMVQLSHKLTLKLTEETIKLVAEEKKEQKCSL